MTRYKARGFIWIENVSRPVYVEHRLEGAETRAEAQQMLDALIRKIFNDDYNDHDPMSGIISVGLTRFRQETVLAVQLTVHEIKYGNQSSYKRPDYGHDMDDVDLGENVPDMLPNEPVDDDHSTVQIDQ